MSSFTTPSIICAKIKADTSEVPPLRARFIDFLHSLGISESEKNGWKLTFSELVNNAIFHGSRNNPNFPVSVSWWIEGLNVWLEVGDGGKGPPAGVAEKPALPEDPLAENGRGMFLVDQFIDCWEHWRSENGYRVRVNKCYPVLNKALPDNPELELILDELSDCYERLAQFDQLGTALLGNTKLEDFLATSIQTFLEANGHSSFHFENAPERRLRELEVIDTQERWKQYGKAKPELWNELEGDEYYLWPDAGHDFPFEASALMKPNGCVAGISVQGNTVALIAIGRDVDEPSLQSREVKALQNLAHILGIAITRSVSEHQRIERNRIHHELGIATELQKSLLPIGTEPPSIPNWEVLVRCEPALEVAGDFAELRPSANGSYVGCVIDVMGKGVSAAILAGIFRSHFIRFADGDRDPGPFLCRVNDALQSQLGSQTMFITGVTFRFYPETGQLDYAAAGHPPALLLPRSGPVQEFPSMGPPIALFHREIYTSASLTIQAGERFCLITDGLFEWTHEGHLFGWEALVKWFGEHRTLSAEETWDQFRKLMKAGKTNPAEPAGDDETLLILTRL